MKKLPLVLAITGSLSLLGGCATSNSPGSDGETSPAEKQLIDRLAEEVGCGTASVNAMIARAQSDPNFHQQQFSILKDDPQKTMAALIEVAMADKKLAAEEVSVLRGIAENLGIAEPIVDELITKVGAMLDREVEFVLGQNLVVTG